MILRFQHRFQAGSLCELEIDLDAVRDNSLLPHFRDGTALNIGRAN